MRFCAFYFTQSLASRCVQLLVLEKGSYWRSLTTQGISKVESEHGVKVQHFDGTNYTFWKARMEKHLDSMLFGVLDVIINWYTPLTSGTPIFHEIKAHENKVKSRNVIIKGLGDS